MVTVKAIIYDLHNFYSQQTIQGALEPCGWRLCHPGAEQSQQECVIIGF